MKTKLLLFGITGDLSTRKLLPALEKIVATGHYDDLSIIGVSRREVNVSELLEQSIGSQSLADRIEIYSMNLAERQAYDDLKDHINLQPDEQLIAYLSVPPMAATQIVDFMGEAGINSAQVKLLFEKPFGVDLASAEDVIARTARFYTEDQIYRIDHYLAKEMAQNIVAFRSGNALFSHIWDNKSIESIEIVALEKIGIEGRASFYEQVGALRDIVQGHLMQLLSLVLLDIPANLSWDSIPELRLEALNSLERADPVKAVRAQYEGYAEEAENPGSHTETFVSVELESSAAKWEGVPIRLTTGKAMEQKTTEIRIALKKFHPDQSNHVIFRIQPNEGIEIELFTKKPGYERQYETQLLNFTYPLDTVLPDAYEQVIVDAIDSRKSLFTEGDEVIRSWYILQPLLDAWMMDTTPLPLYAPGATVKDIIN